MNKNTWLQLRILHAIRVMMNERGHAKLRKRRKLERQNRRKGRVQ